MAHRVQPAQAALQRLFGTLLPRSHAAQQKRQAGSVLLHHGPGAAAIAPFPAGQGTGHLQHDLELAAALANGEDAPDPHRDSMAEDAANPAGPGQDNGCSTGDHSAELEVYWVAEATTNLAAVLINHALQQV